MSDPRSTKLQHLQAVESKIVVLAEKVGQVSCDLEELALYVGQMIVRERAQTPPETESLYVQAGWWSPYVRDGRVHDHSSIVSRTTYHRDCKPVYTKQDKP